MPHRRNITNDATFWTATKLFPLLLFSFFGRLFRSFFFCYPSHFFGTAFVSNELRPRYSSSRCCGLLRFSFSRFLVLSLLFFLPSFFSDIKEFGDWSQLGLVAFKARERFQEYLTRPSSRSWHRSFSIMEPAYLNEVPGETFIPVPGDCVGFWQTIVKSCNFHRACLQAGLIARTNYSVK